MGENQELSTEIIKLLYKDCLYGFNNESVKESLVSENHQTKDTSLKVSENAEIKPIKKRFIVFTEFPLTPNHSDGRYKFLSDIIKACKLNMDDGILIDLQQEHKGSTKLFEIYQPDVVLLFGVSPSDIQLPMIFPQFQLQYSGKRAFIAAPQLDDLEPDKIAKGKFWNCLKQAFSI